MIWHIFKKDWKLSWRFVLIAAAIQFASTAMWLHRNLNFGVGAFFEFILIFEILKLLASAFVIVFVVQQDAIPGVGQDWLVRPVKRRDLLLSKLLFIIFTVQGPIFASDLMQGLASGFPLGQSLTAAASRSIYLLILFDLPFFAFASLTRNLIESVGGIVISGLCIMATEMMLVGINSERLPIISPTTLTGLSWMPDVLRLAVALLGATAVLAIQYRWRKTLVSRWLMGGAAVLCVFTLLLPWHPAFALQQRLSPNPGMSRSVALAFAPSLGKFDNPSGIDLDLINGRYGIRGQTGILVYLPLHVTGLPADTVLKSDRVEVHLTGPDGRDMNLGAGRNLEPVQSSERADTHYAIFVRDDVYRQLKDQPVKLELDYSLSLFKLEGSHTLPALHGRERIPGVGLCASQVNSTETEVRVNCLRPGQGPSCSIVFLEDPSTGKRNPERTSCFSDYSPYFSQFAPDSISRFGFGLTFRDRSHLAQYPVDGSQLPQSQIVMREYVAKDHFARHLVIPDIHLQDWRAQ